MKQQATLPFDNPVVSIFFLGLLVFFNFHQPVLAASYSTSEPFAITAKEIVIEDVVDKFAFNFKLSIISSMTENGFDKTKKAKKGFRYRKLFGNKESF